MRTATSYSPSSTWWTFEVMDDIDPLMSTYYVHLTSFPTKPTRKDKKRCIKAYFKNRAESLEKQEKQT